MKRKQFSLFTVVLVLGLALATTSAYACTVLLVTPGASVDGTASVTHTCDSGNSPYEIFKVEAKDWEPGTMVDVYNLPQYTNGNQMHEVAGNPTGNKIPQVAHTYAYIGALFGVINEKQVAIGETTISGRRESSNTSGFFDITNLSFYAMERASTAREAVEIMGALAEKYGYKDTGEQLAVADPNEVWIIEMVGPGPFWAQGDSTPGAYWVAQRIPDGYVAACANNAIVKHIDFNDPANFLYGPGILEFATDMGWWSPTSGVEFNWRLHFCNATAVTSSRRVWGAFRLFAPSLVPTLVENDLPVFVKPDNKVTINDINAIQRDHYEDTQFDTRYSLTAGPWENPRRYRGLSFRVDGVSYSWQRMIAQVQCEYTITTQSRGWLPDAIGACVWYGPGNPDLTCYMPLYVSVSELSPALNTKAGSHQTFTRESAWWAMNAVSTYANLKYSEMSKDVNLWIDKYEKSIISYQKAIDTAAVQLYRTNPAAAVEFLTNFVNNNVTTVRDAWWDLLDFLMFKYNMGKVTVNGSVNNAPYPEAWLRRVAALNETDHYL